MNENEIIKKLNIDKRSAFNILKDNILCERILKETPIRVSEFSKKYNITIPKINKYIINGIIYAFRNIDGKGSPQFIFEDEAKNIIFKTIKNNSYFDIIKITIEIYLSIVKEVLTPRNYEILYDIIINKYTYEETAIKHHITTERVRQIFWKAIRRIKSYSFDEFNKIKNEHFVLSKQIRELRKEKHILYNELNKNKADFIDIDYEKEKLYDTEIINLDISTRALNCLKMNEINNIKQLASLKKGELLRFRNLGKKTIQELDSLLKSMNLSFAE